MVNNRKILCLLRNTIHSSRYCTQWLFKSHKRIVLFKSIHRPSSTKHSTDVKYRL